MSTLPLTRRFFVTAIETKCSIGIYDHERAAPQTVIVDVEVVLQADAEPTRDHIDNTLDYDQIRDGVLAITSAKHYDLQETLARTIFDKMMSLPTVIQARVRTAKTDIYPDCKEAAYQLSNITH